MNRTLWSRLSFMILVATLCAGVMSGALAAPKHVNIRVSDGPDNNSLGTPNLARKVLGTPAGTILVAYRGGGGIRIARSVDGGASFQSSVQLTSLNGEAEIAGDHGLIVVAWVQSGQVMIRKSVDEGLSFDAQTAVGSTAGSASVHVAVRGQEIFILDGNGARLRSSPNGGASWIVRDLVARAYGDVQVDKSTGEALIVSDDPNLYLHRLSGAAASPTGPISIPGQVYYSTTAFARTSAAPYLYVAGDAAAPAVRINTATLATQAMAFPAVVNSNFRTIAANSTGHVVSTYQSGSNLGYAISTNAGLSFGSPRVVAAANAISLALSASNGDVLVAYEAGGRIFMSSYSGETHAPSTTQVEVLTPELSYVGQPVTVGFDVTGTDPEGVVTITSSLSGPLAGCTDVPVSEGFCEIGAGALDVAGAHALVANYGGDALNLPSTSASVAHRVVEPIVLYRDDGVSGGGSGATGRAGRALIPVGSYPTLAAALAAAQAGDEVVLGADTYLESGLVIAVNDLTVRGFAVAESDSNPWTREPVSVIDGEDAAAPLLTIANGVTGTVLQDLYLRNVQHNCVQGLSGNHDTTLERNKLENCRADLAPGGAPPDPRGAAFFNGPIDGVRFIDNEVNASGPRALVIWNGFKTNILFDGNYIHDGFGCCGIDLQDGTASGVQITGNRIERIPDSGIAAVGLTGGGGAPYSGANLIANNLVLNAGRFGIEIKLPNGSGLDSGDGSIVVDGNEVWLSANGDPDFDGDVMEHGVVPGIVAWRPGEVRDLAGIAVLRRSVAEAGNVEVPAGVVVRGNTVGGYQQNNGASSSTGFGIVLGGVKHTAFNNTLRQNDVGIQRQAGHAPYCDIAGTPAPQPGSCDGDQSDLADQFFGRDNSPISCAAIGSNAFAGNAEATTRGVVAGSGILQDNTVFNQDTSLGYCSIQAAIDDPLTQDGHVLQLADDAVFSEQVLVTKSVRLTRTGTGSAKPVIQAPATVTDLALVRVAAANVEIDNLAFVVDLAKVGEAIRSVGGSVGANPDGLHIHHNDITATATATPFVSYGRRNALALNLAVAPPNEQELSLSVNVHDNAIGGTQDWDAVTAGNQPAYFRSAIALDQGEGVIANNTLRGRDYDLAARYPNQAPLLIQGNTFAGGGLYLGDQGQLVTVNNNTFAPDRSIEPFDAPGARWGDIGGNAVRLVNASPVVISNNGFSDHTNSVFAQNVASLALTGNTFNAPSHGGEFRHLIVSTKVVSTSSHTVTQVPLGIVATGNTFHGSAVHDAVAVELINHDADDAQYGVLDFGGATAGERNHFVGDFDDYFRLDPTDGITTASAPLPYLLYYLLGSASATDIEPFGGDVQAHNNLFGGVLPSAMDFAQYQSLQAATYHDDPNAPETPPAPAALGRVHYGFAAGTIPTSVSVVTAPSPSAIGAAVTVTATIDNAMGATPAGSVSVTAPDSAGCTIADYPTNTGCVIVAGFSAGGAKTVTASFTPTDPVNASGTGNATHLVTLASGSVVVVEPAVAPTPSDNDYTRINQAIQLAGPGVTVELDGDFDWTEPNALASWSRGSNGVGGDGDIFNTGGDDWSIRLPNGVSDVTVRAAVGGARIQGAEGVAGNGYQDFTAFVVALGTNQGWTFQGLTLRGFDLGIGMFIPDYVSAERYNGTQFIGNRIEIGPDGDDDFGNYGIYAGYGEQQTLAGNEIVIDVTDADGASPGPNSRHVGIQIGDSSNTDAFDGLLVSGNAISVVGTTGNAPPRVIGLWENAGDADSSITIENNTFEGSGAGLGVDVEDNNQYGFIVTTQSNGAKVSALRGNTISGAAVGLRSQWEIYAHYVASNAPLLIEGNTFLDNGTALYIPAAYPNPGRYTLRHNRIAGNLVGLYAERADDLPGPGAPGYGGDEQPTQIDADDNWWGSNAGPSGTGIVIESGADSAAVTQASWLQLRGSAAGGPPDWAVVVDLVSSSDGVSVAGGFPDGTALAGLTTTKGTLTPPPYQTTAGQVSALLQGHATGYAILQAALDDQAIAFNAIVPGPVTVNDNVDAAEILPAGATCGAPDFATIQAAIDAVGAGAEILVCPGTYAEDVVVDKALTIRGARAGVAGVDHAGAGSVVVAAADLGLSPGNVVGVLVTVLADDVTLDGLTLDGDNPAIDSVAAPDVNGVDVDYGYGLYAYQASGLTVVNSSIRNVYETAFYGNGNEGDNLFRFNHVINAGGRGIIAANSYYVSVLDNRFDTVRVGVQTNNLYQANPGAPAVVEGNVFNVTRTGFFHNLFYGSASPYTIRGNEFIAAHPSGETGNWRGIWVESMGGSQAVTIQDNDIDASAIPVGVRKRVAYELNNVTTTAPVASRVIAGGTVSNVDVGVLATDATAYTGPVNDFLVDEVTFSNVALVPLYVEDTEAPGSARLTIGSTNDFGAASQMLALSGTAPEVAGQLVPRVLVRAAGTFYYGQPTIDLYGPPPCSICTVDSAPINTGIAAASAGGTVSVEAGTFAQNVVVNKTVTLVGPHAGVHANDAGRGTGEAVVSPASGVGVLLSAADVTVDGLTIGSGGGHAVQRAGGDTADDLRLINNRIVNVSNGSGVFSEPGSVDGAGDGFEIARNVFGTITGSGAQNGRGIVLFKGTTNAQIHDNDFDGVSLYAIQINGGTGTVSDVAITGNRITNTASNAVIITGTTGTSFLGNTVTGVPQALYISDRTSGFTAACNVLSATGTALSSGDFFSGAANGSIRIFHNDMSGGTFDLNSGMAQGLTVGSNWYGGTAPSVSGSAVALLVADPLPASPIGNVACGDNSAVAHGLASGSPQTTDLNQPFAQPLRSRVVDVLGGAVAGETVVVAAPASGASALLTPPGGARTTDYNGVVQTAAIANGFAGSYGITASHATGVATFALTNAALGQVYLDLNGPVTGVQVGEATTYTGTIANESAPVTEPVFLRIAVSGTMDPSDVQLCVQAGPDCLPIQWTVGLSGLEAEFPGDVLGSPISSFDITAPYAPFTHVFRTTYGKAGIYVASAQVVGASSATVYASDTLATEVIAQHAGVDLTLLGPVAGVEKDEPTTYLARLVNTEADVTDNVIVEFVLTRIGGIQAGDVTVEYDMGGGVFAPIPLGDTGGQLSGLFGPAGGFPLPGGYDATTALRVTFHVTPPDPGTYTVQATVIDAVADTDGVPVYAADNLSTQVVDAAPDVELNLSGPFNTGDETLIPARVDEPLVVRGDLINSGGTVPDSVQARFTIGAGFDIEVDDLAARYWFLPGAAGVCDVDTAIGMVTVDASEFVDGGNTLSIATTAQPLPEGFEVAVCFEFTFSHAGVYNVGAVIEDAVPDTDGLSTYAADHLAVTVGKGQASLAFDPATVGSFPYTGSAYEAEVTTTPAGLSGVTITYNGGSGAPVDVGHYAVLATLANPDYEADPITDSIAIGSESVDVTDIRFVEGGTSLVFNGSDRLVTFTSDPAEGVDGIACDVAVNGGVAPPNAAGGYLVTVTCEGPNHFGAASASLTIAPATDSGITLTGGTFVYDGNPHGATVSNPNGVAYTLSYSGGMVPVDVGSYLATLTTVDPNYVSQTLTATITIAAGTGAAIFAAAADPVGVVAVDPQPDADARKSYYTWQTSGAAGEPVRAFFVVAASGPATAGDLVLEYETAPGSDVWLVLPMIFDASARQWAGWFGPSLGFPLVDGAQTRFRAAFARGGRYASTASLFGVNSGSVYAISDVLETDVAHVRLVGSGNTAGVVGVAVDTGYALVNGGTADLGNHAPAPNDENVRGRFTITGPQPLVGASAPSCGSPACASPDVAVEYFDAASGEYRPIYNLQSDGSGGLVAHFGSLSAGGVPVPAGYSGTFLFRTTLKQHVGAYQVRSQVVGVSSGTVYADAGVQDIVVDTGTAAQIVVVGGDGQSATVATAFAAPLRVRVLDAGGNPVQNAAVAFSAQFGANGAGGSSGGDITDANGEASFTPTANTVAGDHVVVASLSNGVSVGFDLGNVADVASQLHLVSGSGQTAPLGQPFGVPLAVRVTDQYGNPVAGESATFTAPPTGASASLTVQAPSDADGRISVDATANGLPGNYVVTVVPESFGASVDIGLANTADAPDALALAVIGSAQATVGTGSYSLRATVTGNGNPVPGVSVTFVVETGSNGAGATVSNVVSITDAAGVATAGLNANTVAGAFTVRAVTSGTGDGTATLTNLADAATTLSLVSGSPQTAIVETAFADLVVRASDVHGNPIAGATVTFVATPAGNGASAALTPVTGEVTTGSDGLASVSAVANDIAGAHAVTATAGFGGPVDFALENTVGGVTISGIVWADNGAASVEYDGTAKPAMATVSGGHVASFTYNGSGTAPSSAGSYLVIATVDDGNVYGTASAMLTITPATVDVDLTGLTQVYDGAAKFASVATDPSGVSGVTVAYEQGGTPVAAPINAGSYDIVVALANPNYVLGDVTPSAAQLVIVPATVEVGFGSLSHVYDGTVKVATVTTTPAGVAGIGLVYDPATPVDAGSYEVEATLSNPNYTLTGTTTATLVIAQANASIILSNLVQTYDGTPKPVTVTTVPAGLPVDVTYDGDDTAPTDVGSYDVEAVIDDPNYTGSASATLQIVIGEAATLVKVAGDAQTATAGTAVAIAPQVRVEDAGGNPVEGAIVNFAVTAGGGSVTGAAVMTDAAGLAAIGSWTLGHAAGGNELTVGVIGSSVTPVVFTATATAQVDAAVSVMALDAFTRIGAIHDHVIVVRNDGVSLAPGVTIDVPLPAEHDPATAQWLCLAAGGATCPATTGTGAINTTASLPAGASLTFLTSAQVISAPVSELITVTADVQAAGDTDPGNDSDSATTVMVLFRNGFDPGGDGSNGEGAQADDLLGEVRGDGSPLTVAEVDRGATVWPAAWLVLETAQGRAVAIVDRLIHQGVVWVRLRDVSGEAQRAGAWRPVDTGLGLALVQRGSATLLLIDTGGSTDEMTLSADAAAGLLVLELGG